MNPTLAPFEPPLSKEGSTIDPLNEPILASGVRGYAIQHGGEFWIPLISAEREGNGDVGKLLDRMTRRCVIVNVTSPRLAGMLKRRGWKQTFDDGCDFWRKS